MRGQSDPLSRGNSSSQATREIHRRLNYPKPASDGRPVVLRDRRRPLLSSPRVPGIGPSRPPSALQNALERGPDARDHENPENGDEKSQRQACWRHKNVKAKNIENNSPQNRKRQRNVAIHKQQDRRPDLQKENHDIKPGTKQCPEEL